MLDPLATVSMKANLLTFTSKVDPLDGVQEPRKHLIDKALSGLALSHEDSMHLAKSSQSELISICQAASIVRHRGKGVDVTFSPKVFIPLTKLCRDFCGYCTFRKTPSETNNLYMPEEEVVSLALEGQSMGCTEALFTLGDRPEQRYTLAKSWLQDRGYRTTIEYLQNSCSLLLHKTRLLPHSNPGILSHNQLKSLKSVNASIGIMLETISHRLTNVGMPHHRAPSKWPKVRLKTLNNAGLLKIPFTTGILVGIGETRKERIEAILAIRESHLQHGHIQEIIVQNFRAKKATPMSKHPNASTEDLLWTVAMTRLVLGPNANIQVPPNLNSRDYPLFLLAGINDWGGVSPLTIDHVNPESPWPKLEELYNSTKALGFRLKPRLPVYPEYIIDRKQYLPGQIRDRIQDLVDSTGYVKGGISRYVRVTN